MKRSIACSYKRQQMNWRNQLHVPTADRKWNGEINCILLQQTANRMERSIACSYNRHQAEWRDQLPVPTTQQMKWRDQLHVTTTDRKWNGEINCMFLQQTANRMERSIACSYNWQQTEWRINYMFLQQTENEKERSIECYYNRQQMKWRDQLHVPTTDKQWNGEINCMFLQ